MDVNVNTLARRFRISSRMHAVLDYLTVGTFLTLPRVMGARPAVTRAVTALALGKLAYTLLTRHEGGIFKVLPLRAHLVMDAVGGAGLAALPFLLEEDDDEVTWSLAGLGLFDILAAPLTEVDAGWRSDDDQAHWVGFSPAVQMAGTEVETG